eukprot:g24671.t1
MKQVEKTSAQADRDLQEMHRYVKKAQEANRLHAELLGRRLDLDVSIPEEEEALQELQKQEAARPARAPPGRASQRLREAGGLCSGDLGH